MRQRGSFAWTGHTARGRMTYMKDDDHDPASEPAQLANDYASRKTWADILEPHGWKQRLPTEPTDHDESCWLAPGKEDRRVRARTRERNGLWTFSTSTVFPAKVTHSKFWAYTILNHAGDMRAAIDALHGQNIGIPRERDEYGNQLVLCDGKFAYTWPAGKEPLAVGDIVRVPPPMFNDMREKFGDQPRDLEVTELGAAYAGPLAEIMQLVRRS